MNRYIAIALLAFLVGCDEEPKLAGSNYITLDGQPIAEGTPMETSESVSDGTHVFYPADANGNPDYTRPTTVEDARRKLHRAQAGQNNNNDK